MSRVLARVDAADPFAVKAALTAALTADGPAVFPVQAATESPDDLPPTVAQRIALVVQTSGSSGRPKRVALTADAVLASAAASDTALGGAGQWLLAVPAHYIAGINVLARSITAQTEPIVLRAGHFDAAAFAAAASELRADRRYTSIVPVQLARLVESAESDAAVAGSLRRLDRILVGGQATPPNLLERARAAGLRVTRTYGSSETCGGCVYDGMPIGTASARIVDGEVRLSGPMLAEEYLDDPEQSVASFITRDGIRWYRTHDTGVIENGVLRVTGRLDRVIVSGGEKVSLDAVERIVQAFPGYADAVAVAVEDPEWGQSLVLVTTSPHGAGASDALVAEARVADGLVADARVADARVADALVADALVAQLGRAARPRRIATVRDIPLLASGKPDRAAVAMLL